MCSIDLVYPWKKVSSGSSYVIILNWYSQVFFGTQLSLEFTYYSRRNLARCQLSLSIHTDSASLFLPIGI